MESIVLSIMLNPTFPQGGSRRTANALTPGTYPAVIITVDQAPGYDEDAAVRVTYSVETDKGVVQYREVFLNDLANERTHSLVEYLKENGIALKDWNDLVGMKFNLTFRRQVRGGKPYLNITEREYCGRDGGDENG